MALFKAHKRIYAYILGSAPTEAETAFLSEYGDPKGGAMRHRNANEWKGEVERVSETGMPFAPLVGPAFQPDAGDTALRPALIIVHRNERGGNIAAHYREAYGAGFPVRHFEGEGQSVRGEAPAEEDLRNPSTVRQLRAYLKANDVPFKGTDSKKVLLKLYAATLEE